MKLDDAPIQQKLTLAIMLTSAVVLFLTVATFTTHEVLSFRQTTEDDAETIARITAAQSSAAVDYENQADCAKILARFGSEPSILLAALYGKHDKLLATYPQPADVRLFPASPKDGEYFVTHEAATLFVPVLQYGHEVGSLYLKWDLSPAYRRIRWAGGVLIPLLIGSMGVALAISNVLQRRISGPILELAAISKAVSVNHDYSVRAKKKAEDELGALTDAFNQMLTRIGEQGEALRKNEEQLRQALASEQASAAEVRALNTDLEDRVTRRTAELAAANLELEAFTSSVSHDLRAPLRHIDSFAQLLQDELSRNPESARQFAARIRGSAQNMSRLVDGLLDLSRLGHASLHRQRFRLNAVVNEVISDLRPEERSRRIEWRVAELPTVNADPNLIKQVFANLISNAVKYTRTREQAVIEIGVEPEASGVPSIFVRDNGAGFDMRSADRIFRVFQRLHRAEDFEGNGIGLATTQRIIQLHGGKIWFHAEVDKGAVFHFTLPETEAGGTAEGAGGALTEGH